jgi:hypothetical protein
MTRRGLTILIGIAVLALSTVMCSLVSSQAASPDPAAGGGQTQGTVAALQATITSMQGQAQSTAQAWMTESAPPTGEPGGVAPQSQLPTDDLTPGSISGKLSYPSDHIPPLRLVAENVETGEYVSMEVPSNTSEYKMENVPPGRYRLVAYLMSAPTGKPALAGGYSQMVPCGLQASCEDHSLIIFEVQAGEESTSIDPGDWYASPGTFPPDPTQK